MNHQRNLLFLVNKTFDREYHFEAQHLDKPNNQIYMDVRNLKQKDQKILMNHKMLDSEETPEVKLKEFLGHTPMQVCCGAVLGFIVALALG